MGQRARASAICAPDITGDPSAKSRPQDDRLGKASRNENLEDNRQQYFSNFGKASALNLEKKERTNSLDFRPISS